MATPAYSLAQDVASTVRLFLGELYYNTTLGIPYFEDVLGKLPPISLLSGLIERAALAVPGVVSAQFTVSKFSNRELTGQILFIDETGAANGVTF
jgi:hypothetical protein